MSSPPVDASVAKKPKTANNSVADADGDAEVQIGDPSRPETMMSSAKAIPPPAHISATSRYGSMAAYEEEYARSVADPEAYWAAQAREHLEWFRPFPRALTGSFATGDVSFFAGGKLNACYNAVDRWARDTPDKVAILYEGDQPTDVRRLTYAELLREVSRCANALLRRGISRGDTVCIYMPMVPEAAVAMLACARIGAIFTVVFAGFSYEALRDRITDSGAVAVICGDEGTRGGRTIALKKTVDKALLADVDSEGPSRVHTVFVHRHTGSADVRAHLVAGRDVYLDEAVARERPVCAPAEMDAEDTLFLLFTSGSTGRPKGVQHSTGGYVLNAAVTCKNVFDLRSDDVYGCVADLGWITGHSYVVWGPLTAGATTLLFESTPFFPDAGRYWDMVARHKITVFYTSPTAVRSLMRFGDAPVRAHDRSSLRVIGSVGEPINPEAWRWLHEVVGEQRAAIVDTFWQTETGGIMITTLPGAVAAKPGAAGVPMFGVQPALLDAKTGEELPWTAGSGSGQQGLLCFKAPWPGMARSLWADHARYEATYFTPYPGYYLTGDGAYRDADGHFWILGRVDDVINVSGHRIGSAEIESALVSHSAVAEAAVVGVPHDIKGQALFAYVTLKAGAIVTDLLNAELLLTVAREVGSFAKPDYVVLAPALPKTRSGKIMRRLLRKVASRETDSLGDLSTLADPDVIDDLIARVARVYQPRK